MILFQKCCMKIWVYENEYAVSHTCFAMSKSNEVADYDATWAEAKLRAVT